MAEESQIIDEDLGFKEMEAKAHPVYKKMIDRFLPKRKRDQFHHVWQPREKHDDDWDDNRYDKEKEGYMPDAKE